MPDATDAERARLAERVADAFDVPPHLVAALPRHRWTWRLRRWARARRRRHLCGWRDTDGALCTLHSTHTGPHLCA
jgi:hypothetical protein